MNNQIILALKKRLEEISAYGSIDAETERNAVKEELQFYVLNFIYHHPKHNNWIMYGGSVLRICHDLNRMSVDLDFEIDDTVNNNFLEELEKEIVDHFKNNYNIDSEFLTMGTTNNRGLTLKFHIGNELGLDFASKQIHIKIDLHNFVPPKTVATENIPINKDQFSFSIKTYNLSALMASKIAAIFLRGQRGVDKKNYEEKGRDIYDLLWYMSKKIVPDLDYLKAKDIVFTNPKELFNKITIKVLNNEKTDENLKQDLTPLFLDQTFINNWLNNWRDKYMRSLEEYEIYTATTLEKINVYQDFHTDIFSFIYLYNTTEDRQIKIICRISDYWIDFGEGKLSIEASEKIKKLFEYTSNGWTSNPPPQDKLMQYTELFYQKISRYLKKTNNIVVGHSISTKLIRMTADNLNYKEQILLNKPALISCELDDLLK
jgi:hypothetical protein